ncbi:hypothetical protein AGJ32_17715 [Cronobacter turicensis]|nr:hypothetical protein [Cronobacter turicensis]EGT5741946.1 hypothetical protein [Cronobacter turicensis]
MYKKMKRIAIGVELIWWGLLTGGQKRMVYTHVMVVRIVKVAACIASCLLWSLKVSLQGTFI